MLIRVRYFEERNYEWKSRDKCDEHILWRELLHLELFQIALALINIKYN